MTIVDLDGTLVDCNSFTEFVKFLFKRCPAARFPLIKIVVCRKLRIISHHAAKDRIIPLAADLLSTTDIKEFVEFLCSRINTKVKEIITGAEGVCLATAAPEIYVSSFASEVSITRFNATRQGGEENKGKHKLDNLLNSGIIFDENTIVITDHRDDLPLLKANCRGVNYIVNPSRRSLEALRQEGIRFEII